MIQADLVQIAAEFWRNAALPTERPRPIERAVGWTLPIAVVSIPRLGFEDVRHWLSQRGVDGVEQGPDRPLRACLVASRGRGVVFVDASDSDAERRFSIAHEVAHFILDYERPRQEVIATLGLAAADVLDGVREPTAEEKLGAVLRGVPLGSFRHLMVRGPRGAVTQRVLAAEDRADQLALELLAPRTEVVRLARRITARVNAETIREILVAEFGLPDTAAKTYAEHIASTAIQSTSIRKWLGL